MHGMMGLYPKSARSSAKTENFSCVKLRLASAWSKSCLASRTFGLFNMRFRTYRKQEEGHEMQHLVALHILH